MKGKVQTVIKTTLKIEGMMCGMCEAHVRDAIRNSVPEAKKVTASRRKKEATFLTEEPIDTEQIKRIVGETGYECLSADSALCVRRGIFGRK